VLRGRDLLAIADLTRKEVLHLLETALTLKQGNGSSSLAGKTLALVFQKPSLRTRVSFDVAMHRLGGHVIYLSQAEVGLGQREPVADVARVLSRYVDGIVARTFCHSDVVELAKYASVPVINGLSDEEHPCQAMADLLTIREKKGRLEGVSLAYIGDSNNIANSLLLASALVGMNFTIASPLGFQPSERIMALAESHCARSGARVAITDDPRVAVTNADVIYTDVWTSMGQEAEAEERRRAFAGFQVTCELVSLAKRDVIVMHDLPAHRGEEITDEVLESEHSVVFDQAENRMHAQEAVLFELLGSSESTC